MIRHAKLTEGRVYPNRNGSAFLVISVYGGDSVRVRNIKSGWECTAHVITMYDDGTVEWDYSTGGCFI